MFNANRYFFFFLTVPEELLGDLDSGREVWVRCSHQTLTVAATFMLYWLLLRSGCTTMVVLQCRLCREVAAASSKKAPK